MNQKNLLWIVVGLALLGLAIWFVLPRTCPPLSDNLAALRDAAVKLQGENKNDEAKAKWQDFLKQLPMGECYGAERRIATENTKLLEKRIESRDLTDGVMVRPKPANFQPESGLVDRASKYYVTGKKVVSKATCTSTGLGVSRDWGINKKRHFAYMHEVPLETVVLDNVDGKQLTLQVTVGDLSQLLAYSESELQLDPPDSAILETLFKEADRQASNVPQYRVIRWLANFLRSLDPGLKKTLTNFNKLLRKAGLAAGDDSEITYIARIKELAGMKAKLDYVVGLGVIKLEVIDGKKYLNEDLLRFAHDADILVDLVVGKEIEAAGDKPFEIDAAQIGSLLSLDCEVTGKLKLQKVAVDEKQNPNVDRYEIIGGRVSLSERNGGSGDAIPQKGSFMKFDRKRYLVTEAQIEWQIDVQKKSHDHIFFEAEELVGLRVKSHYRAIDLTEAKK